MSLLYHYTNIESFLSIINSNSLWVTSSSYLNDYTEGQFGENLITKLCNIIKEKNEYVAEAIHIQNYFIKTFLFSFCEDGDLLSQWKHYGKSSTGISIGFNRNKLFELQKSLKYNIIKIDYVEKNHTKEFKTIEKDILDFLSKSEVNKIDSLINAIKFIKDNPLLSSNILSEIYSLKHETFKEEKEWRIISTSYQHEVYYRYSNEVLLPYIIIKFKNILDYIDTLILNPNASKRSINSIKEFLYDKGLVGNIDKRNIDVQKSKIPFTE